MELVEILKALADETRLRIVNILKNGEFCVCDIENSLNINQSNASKHLNKLKSNKIIVATKKAQWVYYSINYNFLMNYPFIDELLKKSLNDEVFTKDLKNLKKYLENKKGCDI